MTTRVKYAGQYINVPNADADRVRKAELELRRERRRLEGLPRIDVNDPEEIEDAKREGRDLERMGIPRATEDENIRMLTLLTELVSLGDSAPAPAPAPGPPPVILGGGSGTGGGGGGGSGGPPSPLVLFQNALQQLRVDVNAAIAAGDKVEADLIDDLKDRSEGLAMVADDLEGAGSSVSIERATLAVIDEALATLEQGGAGAGDLNLTAREKAWVDNMELLVKPSTFDVKGAFDNDGVQFDVFAASAIMSNKRKNALLGVALETRQRVMDNSGRPTTQDIRVVDKMVRAAAAFHVILMDTSMISTADRASIREKFRDDLERILAIEYHTGKEYFDGKKYEKGTLYNKTDFNKVKDATWVGAYSDTYKSAKDAAKQAYKN